VVVRYQVRGTDLVTEYEHLFTGLSPRGQTARTPTAPGRRRLGLLRSRPDPVHEPTRALGPAACPRGGLCLVVECIESTRIRGYASI